MYDTMEMRSIVTEGKNDDVRKVWEKQECLYA